ncbi:flagellar motor protein MotB [Clostridium aceticum]|uniref:Flagellar motor protein MotB n=1 Tax=Clostridium aceticum TaxID=84022 RepID=A0A0D8I6V1_9CLOT|nr:flagellar motor protein MotB [Clostridium aceticum]AKL95473.1 flagellar motor protein MotB [Clostridium aceticum]KJF25958.1 flagellar motor protein MotB [Clostridium aceticum]
MARKSRSEDSAPKGSPEWMTTYGDMVTLLLCFFILLFAFSEIDVQKFEAIIQSFQGSLGVLDAGKTIESSDYIFSAYDDELTTKQIEELEDFRKLQERLQEFLENRELEGNVLVTMETRGLVLRFQDNVLFDSGKAIIKEDSKEILAAIAEFLEEPEFEEKFVNVEGHTDTDPLRPNAKYETNWELSVARAANVVRLLIEDIGLQPARFSASGYGEYQPVALNDTQENKAKNRRVDIVILRSELTTSAPYNL